MENSIDRKTMAKQLFGDGYNCAQSVLGVYTEESGISLSTALKISKHLGGGFIYKGELCGAISGSCLMFSLAFASDKPGDTIGGEIINRVINGHLHDIKKEFVGILCKEILEFNIAIPEELEKIRQKNYFTPFAP